LVRAYVLIQTDSGKAADVAVTDIIRHHQYDIWHFARLSVHLQRSEQRQKKHY